MSALGQKQTSGTRLEFAPYGYGKTYKRSLRHSNRHRLIPSSSEFGNRRIRSVNLVPFQGEQTRGENCSRNSVGAVSLSWNASVYLKQRENGVSNKENRDDEGAFSTIDTRRATEGTRWDGSTPD